MRVRPALLLLLAITPLVSAEGQQHDSRRTAACRCEPSSSKPRKPRFLLPLVGGIGILPISIAARDSGMALLAFPSLVDIPGDDDATPRNALEGERALEVGALAPDTATSLPTIMLVAGILVAVGLYLVLPRRRRRQVVMSWRSRMMSGTRGRWRLRTVHRRRIGGMVAATGGLFLVLGSREYAEGAQAQRKARAEWIRMGSTVVRVNEPERQLGTAAGNAVSTMTGANSVVSIPATGSAVPLPVFAISGKEIRRGTPVARLIVPSIDLDEIVTEGVGPVELNGGPGHFPGSVLPGDPGNSILSAHRDRHFSRVGELAVGARIRTETRDQVVEWVVTERRILSRDTPALFAETEATLTLTTCWPIRYFGPAPDRLLIVAKRAG